MAIVRSVEEIKARMKEVENQDWIGTRRNDLLAALSFEDALPFLKEGVTSDQWSDPQDPIVQAREYLAFAMGKAENHRGISAGRSVEHFTEWAWLSGDDAFQAAVADSKYANYGAPILAAVAKAIGAEDEWMKNSSPQLERMSHGIPCSDGCDEGCAYS